MPLLTVKTPVVKTVPLIFEGEEDIMVKVRFCVVRLTSVRFVKTRVPSDPIVAEPPVTVPFVEATFAVIPFVAVSRDPSDFST